MKNMIWFKFKSYDYLGGIASCHCPPETGGQGLKMGFCIFV